MGYVVDGDVVYEVLEYPDGGSAKQIKGTITCIELEGPVTGQTGVGLVYIARLVTWQGELITGDPRSIRIEVWGAGEKLGELNVSQGEEFELVFPTPGQYEIRTSIEGTHTPANKVVVIGD